jgi:acyl-coenzyme A thioesterase PaaI-like protein
MPASEVHEEVRARAHPGCIACSPTNPGGLKLQFTLNADGSVSATRHCDPSFEGYPGYLHGGIIALIFDSVMVNCLFARGYLSSILRTATAVTDASGLVPTRQSTSRAR